jgi:hypothetical protein
MAMLLVMAFLLLRSNGLIPSRPAAYGERKEQAKFHPERDGIRRGGVKKSVVEFGGSH